MKVGLLGCGAIGTYLAKAIENGLVENTSLDIIHDRHIKRAQNLAQKLKTKPKIALTFEEIIDNKEIELVIEAASQEAVRIFAPAILKASKNLMIMSVGALLDEELLTNLKKMATQHNVKIFLPSGAIAGIDAIKAAALAGIDEVTLTSKKPIKSLADAPYIAEKKIDLSQLKEPMLVFEGPANEAVKWFPANINVAATLSIACGKPEKVRVKIVADPKLDRIVHEIKIKGKTGELLLISENIPSPDNPRTSLLAALSAVATLQKISGMIVLGT
ncbi:MAG: aspartate dehydrogenase [Euryarchaeota archaeon]|nr:aspartate dehydrogenase [Euryarchaeota archaeon]